MTFITQIYQNLQNVNKDNMNLFYDDKDQKLTGYFNQVPCIASGVGNITTKFGQIGTTNQFAFTNGAIRFTDQPTPLGSSVETIFTQLTGSTVTVTAPSSPPAQLYVVAVLTMTQLDSFKVENTVAISTTAMTLADIAGETNPLAYLPLFAITNTAGNYSIFVDSNCAFNYYNLNSNPITPSITTYTSNGTFIVPANVTSIYVTACGAGGGGSGASGSGAYSGAGGGSGESIIEHKFTVTPGSSISITTGIHGNGGAVNNSGTDGTATIIGSLATLNGGKGASTNNGGAAVTGAWGGSSAGQGGCVPAATTTNWVIPGGNGASSIFGLYGSGGINNSSVNGADGQKGSGGGGGAESQAGAHGIGGDGGDGFVIIKVLG